MCIPPRPPVDHPAGGVPLFAGSGPQHRLRLVESTPFESGVIQAPYVPLTSSRG